jgi:hypothetical protein
MPRSLAFATTSLAGVLAARLRTNAAFDIVGAFFVLVDLFAAIGSSWMGSIERERATLAPRVLSLVFFSRARLFTSAAGSHTRS